ncbi:hypothetical protein ABZS83_26780 [Streptomyces sp. NPDC005426]|uniref:effector-associated constant component EACC1 n=1 Tax=Streptomyces sp. NPDC005426 TaxID=3155344 RepID=UPI0033BD9E0A
MQEYVIEFPGTGAEADAHARDLAGWLDESGELRGASRVRMVPARPGEQGGAADAVMVLAAATPLYVPFFNWLVERRKAGRVTVRVVRPDGTEQEIEAGDADDAARLLGEVRRALDVTGDE